MEIDKNCGQFSQQWKILGKMCFFEKCPSLTRRSKLNGYIESVLPMGDCDMTFISFSSALPSPFSRTLHTKVALMEDE